MPADSRHPDGLGEVQAGLQSIHANADQVVKAVTAASDQLKVISSKMDQTAARVVAQAELLELQLEKIKAIGTLSSQLEALGRHKRSRGERGCQPV